MCYNIYVYIYIHTHIYIYMNTISKQVHSYLRVEFYWQKHQSLTEPEQRLSLSGDWFSEESFSQADTHLYLCTKVSINNYVYIYIYIDFMHIYLCIYVFIYLWTFIYIYIYIMVFNYICLKTIHMCVYMCACLNIYIDISI